MLIFFFADPDTDLIPTASQCTSPLNLSMSQTTVNQTQHHHQQHPQHIATVVKSEPEDNIHDIHDNMMEVNMSGPTVPSPLNLVNQPTIILTTNGLQNGKVDRLVLPHVNIKLEPQDLSSSSSEYSPYDSVGLPPTPPSSSNSDSEGGSSPQRSAPSSPIRHTSMSCDSLHGLGSPQAALFSSPVSSCCFLEPLFHFY